MSLKQIIQGEARAFLVTSIILYNNILSSGQFKKNTGTDFISFVIMFGEISLVFDLSIRALRATLIDHGLGKYRQGSNYFLALQVFF